MSRIRCTDCGKKIRVGPADAGQLILCSACGASLQAPLIIPPDDPDEAEAPVEAIEATASDDPATPPAVRPSSPATQPAPQSLWIIALAAAFILIAAGVTVTIVLANRKAAVDDKPAVAPATRPTTQGVVIRPAPAPPATQETSIWVLTTQPVTMAPLRPAPEPVTIAPIIAPTTAPATKPADPAPIADDRRPPARNVPIPTSGVTDEQIGDAIQKSADFLLSQFQGPTLRGVSANRPSAYEAGLDALCVYALLQAGQAIHDERLNVRGKILKDMLDKVRDMPIDGQQQTYAHAIRATALAVYNRPEDRAALKNDNAWLVRATKNGGYTYLAQTPDLRMWDNSNSQYGLLGVWSAAEVGGEVPRTYWAQVQNHWFECQCDNGQWAYRSGGESGSLSMTVAGIASLFVTHDYLDAAQFGKQVGRDPFSKPLARGLAWLEEGDNSLTLTGMSPGYALYGLERVGLASGFKYFGENDWYRRWAAFLVKCQNADGSWDRAGMMPEEDPDRIGPFRFGARRRGGRAIGGDDLVETAYCLLFLARGRHPVLMNKLRFDRQGAGPAAPTTRPTTQPTTGYWANRPRDLANLARFASRELERPLNWQVVPLSRDYTDWLDSPILYIASHQAVPLREGDYVKLRRFVDCGGLIFLHADGTSGTPTEPFDMFARSLARNLFPAYEWKDLPDDHEIYSINYQINPRPRLKQLTNGSRLLMLYSPEDISQHWQQRAEKTRANLFQLGVNLFIYSAGKTDLRNRLSSPYLPEPSNFSSYRIRLARVAYNGNWDPEPGAFTRFSRQFYYQTGYGLDVSTFRLASLNPKTYPIAHMTGTAPWTPNDSDIAALRAYVENGGTLIIDACGGSSPFAVSASSMIGRAFPAGHLAVAGSTHPLFAGRADGMEPLPKPLLRPYADRKLGRSAARIEILSAGKGHVIFSSLDLTTALLGTDTWAILGYQPAYAQSLMRNAVLWAADGAKE